jgi:hypothetical protein
VIEAQVHRSSPLSRDLVEAAHDAVGVDGPLHLDGEALAGVLVDHVQELQHPPVGRLVELEVERPEHVRGDRAHGTDSHADAAQRSLALSVRKEAFGPPEAVDALVVDLPALLPCCDGGPPPAPAWSLLREVPQERPQRQLGVGYDRRRKALGGTGLADDLAGPALGDPEPLGEHHDGSPATVRG